MEQEEWRPVVGWEQYYEVSNLGRVRRIRTGRILSQRRPKKTSGYCVSFLVPNRPHALPTVARLLAEAFICKQPEPDMGVFHKDQDVTNNQLDNLIWAKFNPRLQEGIEDRPLPTVLLTDSKQKRVICVETGVVYPSVRVVAAEFNMSEETVRASCRNGVSHNPSLCHSNGKPIFHFRYYNPEDYKPKERVWRVIPGMGDKYEVSNMGEVRCIHTQVIRRTYRVSKRGTISVNLWVDRKERSYSLCRLVAEAFLPRPYGATRVVHRDGDASNNCVTNLYWSDISALMANPISKHRQKENIQRHRVLCENTGVIYSSMQEAARVLHLTVDQVHLSCRRAKDGLKCRRKSYRGKPVLHFRYADQ